MPELPDIELYLFALGQRLNGEVLRGIRLRSPFLLRSVVPALTEVHGLRVLGFRRLGKRVVFEFEEDLFLVIHLMVAGRFQWSSPAAKLSARSGLAAFDFDHGTLILTEASKKKRARLHVVRGEEALAQHDPGGTEPLGLSRRAFAAVLLSENHTLKRTLTDPRLFSGIGNAYSDEILFAARLSPVRWTSRLTEEQITCLYDATQLVLLTWRDRLLDEHREAWPKKVTAFRPDMAVHGRYGQPCRVCDGPIQRIRYASNETNYCPSCQNEGKLLADRSLSRLLKKDWPKTLDALEAMKRERSE